MWLVFAFGSAIFAGLTAILSKVGVRNTDSTVTTAYRTIVVLIFSWIMVFVANVQGGIVHIGGKTLFFLILSGFATGGSWLCYFKALQIGDVNKVTPIDKSSTILTMILAFIFLEEKMGWLKFIAMIVMAVGTFLMIQKRNNDIVSANRKRGWFLYATGSAVFASLTSILGKVGIDGVDSTLGTAIRTIVVLLMAWAMVFITGKKRLAKKVDLKSMIFILLSGVATGASWLCYYRALQLGDVNIVAPIDKLSIVLTIGFSYLFLKEKLTRKALVGLLLIVIGTLLLLV